jgi:hypothetical protein
VAERIVSPGVFSREIDSSFLPQAIAQIGAALIGPTVKGPAFVPTPVSSFRDFSTIFGGFTENSYIPYTADAYLNNAPGATIIRVLGTGGYELTNPVGLVANTDSGSYLLALLHPTYAVTTDGSTPLYEKSTITVDTGSVDGSFVLMLSGSFVTDTSAFTNASDKNGTTYSASLDINSQNYIGKIFGYSAVNTTPAYNYTIFPNVAAEIITNGYNSISIETGSALDNWDFSTPYKAAETPWITSQAVGGNAIDLFKFAHLSDGNVTNMDVKIAISNIKPAGTIAGSQYGQFDVIIRYVDQSDIKNPPFSHEDDDLRPAIVEQFTCNLDPNSALFIGNVIGDRYYEVDSEGQVSVLNDYTNKSSFVRVILDEAVKNGAIDPSLVPFGFRALYSPIPDTFTQPPSASYVQAQTIGGTYNKRKYWGFDFDFQNTDNVNYLCSLPSIAQLTTGNNSDFMLSNFNQPLGAAFPSATSPYTGSIDLSSNTSIESRKFAVPFQGGFDGQKPNLQKRTGQFITATNTQGFDISSTSAAGYVAYKKAIDAVSNKDEYDINMVVLPGVLHSLHSSITTYAKDMVEERGDSFYIMDPAGYDASVADVVNSVAGMDSNYTAVYYPWVRIVDSTKNKPVWVPPSVVLPGVFAFNDRVAAEWYAPAGLNRGGLPEVIDAKVRLSQPSRDTLYENRINPIGSFPGQGVCVWGQKTLQGRPSALDRINVRRMMIAVKKFIAASTRFLVFEQNTAATRNRFLNIVNPYLESIQQRQGLSAFRVIMDETNNTPDVIDRNIMYGVLYLQPTKTAEFIQLDFNIQPTGAEFPE